MTEELHGALRLVRNWEHIVQCIYMQNDCTHKMAATDKKADGLYNGLDQGNLKGESVVILLLISIWRRNY